LPLGDGADTVVSAGRAYVFYDPFFDLDRQHAARLQHPNTTLLKTWSSNHFAAPMLRKLNLLKPVMLGAMDATLEPDEYYRMMRARRLLPMYMRGLEAYGSERHPALVDKARRRFKTLRRKQAGEQAQGAQ
jgi:hypothetical protein